jgi:hypothetical protein
VNEYDNGVGRSIGCNRSFAGIIILKVKESSILNEGEKNARNGDRRPKGGEKTIW